MSNLKLRRVRFRQYTMTSQKNGWVEITGLCRHRSRRKPSKPTALEGSYVVSENGFFIRENAGNYNVCPLSKQERLLVRHVVGAGNQADWEDAFSAIWPGKMLEEQPLRRMISHINAKLTEQNFDVRMSLTACEVRVVSRMTENV